MALQVCIPILSILINMYCLVICLLSVFSPYWYTGEAGSYGIADDCFDKNVTDVYKMTKEVCEFEWEDLIFTKKVTVSFLFAASALGAIAFSFLSLMVLCRCCFRPRPCGHDMANYLSFFQFLCIGSALITLSGINGWVAPEGTSVGLMFILVGMAGVGALLNAFLLSCSKDIEQHKLDNSIHSKQIEKYAAQPAPYVPSYYETPPMSISKSPSASAMKKTTAPDVEQGGKIRQG